MKYLYLGLTILVLVGIAVGIIFLPQKIIITQINCPACDSDLQVKFKSLIGKNWRTVNTKVSSDLTNNPEVIGSAVKFKLPNTLDVDVVYDQPLYMVHPIGGTIYYFINKNGLVIKIAGTASLPTLDYSGMLPNVGEKVDPKMLFALDTLNAIYYSYQIKSAVVKDDSLTVVTPEGISVIFPLEGDQKALLGAFKLIIDRLKIGGSQNGVDNLGRIGSVDLRFKNPVLK